MLTSSCYVGMVMSLLTSALRFPYIVALKSSRSFSLSALSNYLSGLSQEDNITGNQLQILIQVKTYFRGTS